VLSKGRTTTQARRCTRHPDVALLVNVPDLKDRWEGPETGRKTGELYHRGPALALEAQRGK
jgi:hypothetical protein